MKPPHRRRTGAQEGSVTGGEGLHPELRRRLDEVAGRPPMHSLPVETVRAGLVARYRDLQVSPVASVEDRTIATPPRSVRVRIYGLGIGAARPLVVFLHGGGFVIGSIESHDGLCRRLCHSLGFPVLSVDYALAPEHRFPAAIEDCVAAVRWAAAHAPEFGADPDRIVLAGDSAGANLALVSTLLLAAQADIRVSALVLAYPVVDAPDDQRRSYVERGEGFGLTAQTMHWFFDHYLDDPSLAADPRVSPLRSPNLGALPPTYLLTAEYDPLRDEGIELAAALARSGVDVTHVHHDDANHAFLSWAGTNDPSARAIELVCDWVVRKVG
jgi:acetyl esterase